MLPMTPPQCPCGAKLECFWQRRQEVFSVLHARSDCPLGFRWEEFGRSEKNGTEGQAWASAQATVENFSKQSTI